MPLTVTEISAPDILAVARIQEKRGAMETAHCCIQVIGQVFRYGMAVGAVFADPTPALKGTLPLVKTRHMAAPTDPVIESGGITANGCGEKVRTLSFYCAGATAKTTAMKQSKRHWPPCRKTWHTPCWRRSGTIRTK